MTPNAAGSARLDAAWLDDPAPRAVVTALERAGHRVLFVGGAVRNTLLGLDPGDIDLATDAIPGEVIAAAAEAGLRSVPTGIDHGTVTVVAGGRGFEVTTFRRDVATDGRRAVVAFSREVAEDAARRDFTMNALYATPSGDVVDPLCGLPDLRQRRVRFVGDASARIREDYLRILRFFRFCAWYGQGAPDPGGLAACRELSAGIETLSRERVWSELRKLLTADAPWAALSAMAATGVLGVALPGASADLDAFRAREAEAGLAPDPILRLAALQPADPGRLRLSRAEARALADLRVAAESADPPSALAYRFGPAALGAVVLRSARTGAPLPPDLAAQIVQGSEAVFPIRAADLAPLAGAALGDRLRALESRWIASGFTLRREDLLG